MPGWGQETLLQGREGHWGPPEGWERLGVPYRSPGVVGRSSNRTKKARKTLPKGR